MTDQRELQPLTGPPDAPPTRSSTPECYVRLLPSESDAVVLAIGGAIARSDIPGICEGVRVLLLDRDSDLVVCDLVELDQRDAVAVDALARLQLTARRLGCTIRLRHADREVRGLVVLMGLCDALPLDRA
jgi:ABC-type transporter Mla MlaB component